MRIIRRYDGYSNQLPENKEEEKWLKQHEQEFRKIKENKKCLCGFELGERNPLIDLGYKYGFECMRCS